MALVHARAQLKFLFSLLLQISQQNSVTEEEEELFLIQRRQLLNIFLQYTLIFEWDFLTHEQKQQQQQQIRRPPPQQ